MVEKRQPWMRFYTADWRGDAGLRAVGYAARGLWMDMLSLMHEATPYGHLVLNGQPLDATRLAARLGGTAKEVEPLLHRLETEAVFSRTADGVIFSRRMINDAEKAERDRVNGKGGGNPALVKPDRDKAGDNGGGNGGVNPQDNLSDNQYDIPHARACRARPLPLPESKEDTGPTGPDAEAASPPSSPDLLWREGIPILMHLTGKSDGQCRGLLGRLRSNVQNDCPKLLMILQQARDLRPTDPVAWITAATQDRQRQQHARRETPSEERRRKLGISSMFDTVNEPATLDGETQHVRHLPH